MPALRLVLLHQALKAEDLLFPAIYDICPAPHDDALIPIHGLTGILTAFHIGDLQVQFKADAVILFYILDLLTFVGSMEIDPVVSIGEIEGA